MWGGVEACHQCSIMRPRRGSLHTTHVSGEGLADLCVSGVVPGRAREHSVSHSGYGKWCEWC